MAMGAQAEHEMIAVDAFDRRLAGRINLGNNNRVGIVETSAEFLEQRLQPGEAVRLHHGDDLAVGRFTRRFKDGRDLDGVVAVIVDHGDAVPFAGPGEAPLDAAEARDRLADRLVGHAEFVRHRNRRRRVRGVMPSRHRQHDVRYLVRGVGLAVAEHDLEFRAAAVRRQVDQPHIGLRVFAIGDDAAVLDLADEGLHHGMIGAHHGKAVERHVLDEIAERVLDRLERLEVIEMLGIDVGDDHDIGRQLQERAVALVGLDHHPVAGAEPGVGAVGVDDAAIDHGRIETAGIEQRRHHRRRGGLAMGAGNRDAAFQPHQFGQHFGPAHHRNALGAGRHQFRIVALDRGRDHDHVGAVDILGLVADRDLDALLAQPRDIAALGGVRALHGVAEIDQHLGDAAHADAADPDEVNGSDLARQSHDASLFVIARLVQLRRAIQYSAKPRLKSGAAGYWMPRFRGA